jgi:hypothetical protein
MRYRTQPAELLLGAEPLIRADLLRRSERQKIPSFWAVACFLASLTAANVSNREWLHVQNRRKFLLSWDVDWFFLPEGVADGGRPYYSRSFQIFETRSGRCLAMDVINATDDIVERAANQLAGLMLRSRNIPQLVRVQKPELLVGLQP